MKLNLLYLIFFTLFTQNNLSQGTRLLRNPDLSDNHITFTYASDIWIVNKSGGLAKRITSTPAVENDPYFSPNGKWLVHLRLIEQE